MLLSSTASAYSWVESVYKVNDFFPDVTINFLPIYTE